MRLVVLILALAMLAGCGDRRSFDERYADTERNLQQRARHLDAELNNVGAEDEADNGADREQ